MSEKIGCDICCKLQSLFFYTVNNGPLKINIEKHENVEGLNRLFLIATMKIPFSESFQNAYFGILVPNSLES